MFLFGMHLKYVKINNIHNVSSNVFIILNYYYSLLFYFNQMFVVYLFFYKY